VSLQKVEDIKYYAQPSVYKYNIPSSIDRCFLTTNDAATLLKTTLSQVRTPELGDKFSSRHGQKGVFGLQVDEVSIFLAKKTRLICRSMKTDGGQI
jgi:DNA-directed RNA polymerase beta subunit